MVDSQPLTVRCPICSTDVAWVDEHSFKPFCSLRCKQTDLGAWASGDYRVPATGVEDVDDRPDEGAR